jgi:hypothetical protein
MRRLIVVGVAVCSALLLGTTRPRAAGCDPAGAIRFVCDQSGPEDLAVVPGSEWVLSSGMTANGAIHLVNVRNKTTTVLFPSATVQTRLDKKTYDSCPGPIDPEEKDKFRAHGLYLRPGSNGLHTLYMVHHGNRESIEIFELAVRPTPPVLTWIGCAIAPEPIGLNSVVGLPDGGFVTTNFSPRTSDAAARTRMMAGENNGELWEWHPGQEWKIVAGSESAGPNGLEISNDGRWLYIGEWGKQAVVRLSRGLTPVKRDAVPVGFRVDNVRWAPDHTLLAAGQGGTAPSQTSNVAKVNPKSLKVEQLVSQPYGDVLTAGTVAIQLKKELWVGSVRGDRLVIFPVRR